MFVFDLTFTMGTGLIQGKSWQQAGWGRIVTMVFKLDDEKTKKTTSTTDKG
jgi:hypothetical protein